MIFESFSPDDTYEFAYKLGEKLKPGTVIALNGDLGAGKTLFTGGLAAGLGIRDNVNSPTYTIMQIYDNGRLPLYHFDVYRIEDPDEMMETGLDDYLFGDGVCVIEWAEFIDELMPREHTKIKILTDPAKGPDYRRIEMIDLQKDLS